MARTTDGKVHYGFGSLWMPCDRRGDFQELIRSIRARHRYTFEIKWNKVDARSLPFYRELVEAFFKRRWLMFHALVIRKGYVDKIFHRDSDEARRKHFDLLLTKKIEFFSRGSADKRYRLRLDAIPSRYKKADEAAFKIINASLKQRIGHPAVENLLVRDSKATPGIQMADLLIGAVVSAWNQPSKSGPKAELQKWIAHHLGWNDLYSDTKPNIWKFNVWFFYDPTKCERREAVTRPVRLLHWMPEWKPRRSWRPAS